MELLEQLEAALNEATPEQLAAIDRLTAPERAALAAESGGPQTMAYESEANILLYGGQAGGGKSDLLIGLALTKHKRSSLYRRAHVDIIAEGGLGPRLVEILGSRQGYRESPAPSWTDGKRSIEFGALEKPGAEKNAQGRAKDFYGFDEGAQLSQSKIRFVLGWLRSKDVGQRCRVVIATNPPQDNDGLWVVRWFQPWLDPAFINPAKPGELRWGYFVGDALHWVATPDPVTIEGETYTPLSFTFIPSALADNPYYANSGYRERLQNMPEPLRSQLLHGSFMAGQSDHAFQIIPRAWVLAAQERWKDGRRDVPQTVLGVDVAQGGEDNSTFAPLYGHWFDKLVIVPGKQTKDGPSIAGHVTQIRRGNSAVVLDCTGGWGGSARDVMKAQNVPVVEFIASGGTEERQRPSGVLGFKNLRALAWWRMREGLDPSTNPDLALPPDDALTEELCSPIFHVKGTDILVESKAEIRERLGRSTDRADAVVQANLHRDTGMRAVAAGGGWWAKAEASSEEWKPW